MSRLGHTATNPVVSVQSTFRILETLKDAGGGGVTEIARTLDLPKSTVHNHLSTLEQEGYVTHEDGEYHLSLRFLNLGSFARHRREIYEVARPEVAQLADDTGELANLLAEEHGEGVYLYRDTGSEAVNVDSYTGHRVHLHNTALGKAVLAYMPREYVEEIIDTHGMPATTEHTITDRATLFEELEKIRDQNMAFDHEERLTGLKCVAVPITDDNDRAVGAISVSGPRRRMQGARFEEDIPDLLLDAANVIELNLTYS